MLAAALAAIALLAMVFLVSYLVSGKLEGTRRGVVNRIRHYIPFQSIKIVIVSWQILTQVRGGWNVKILKGLRQVEYSRQVGPVFADAVLIPRRKIQTYETEVDI